MTKAQNRDLNIFIGYVIAMILFLLMAQDGYSIGSILVAWLVFVIGTLPMILFIAKRSLHVPVIELMMLAYANAFSIPLFFQTKQNILVKTIYPEDVPVTFCLFMALLATTALWYGFKLSPSLLKGLNLPRLNLRCNNRRLFYYGLLLCFLSLAASSVSFGTFQGLVNVVASLDLGVALLAFLYYKGVLNHNEKIFVLIIIALLVLNGISSGMAQAMLQPLVIWFVCRWLVTRKLEISFVVVGVVLLVLIQPVKLEYRNVVWFGETQKLNTIEKIDTFTTIFYEYWFVSDKEEKIVESTFSRTSLLLQTAHVIDWTPNVVPYRNGETFYFMAVTWIPRFIWPDKPTAQQANINYAIDYGVTTKEGIKTTMFGVGYLGDVYMNFGALGVVPIFLILGVLCYLPVYLLSISQEALKEVRATDSTLNIAAMALLIAVIFKLIFIGSSISDSFGGLIQLIVVQGVLLTLVAGVRKRDRMIRVKHTR